MIAVIIITTIILVAILVAYLVYRVGDVIEDCIDKTEEEW